MDTPVRAYKPFLSRAGPSYLGKSGDRCDEGDVQSSVVLGKGHCLEVLHQGGHRFKHCRLREPILAVGVDDADQLVGPALPDG